MRLSDIQELAEFSGLSKRRTVDACGASAAPRPGAFDAWYHSARPFLSEIAPDDLAALERQQGWHRNGEPKPPALEICMVGRAGSGKSTLLNSLISERLEVVPSGGVGPYTAGPIAARYAPRAQLEFCYRSSEVLDELANALQVQREPESIARARLLLCGDTSSALSADQLLVLLDRLRAGDTFPADDEQEPPLHWQRLRRTLRAVRNGSRVARLVLSDLHSMNTELELHAAGFLAPLTESIEVGWQSPLLEAGVCLIDLPGFGIANDQAQAAARAKLANALGVLWTVDRSGLTSDTLSEVKRTGLLARLADKPDEEAAPHLIVAITKLDLIALDERRRYKRGGRPKFGETLEQLRAEAVGMVEAQLREALRSASDDPQARQRALQRIAVVGIAPVDYRRFYLGDEDEPSRITSPSLTGVPLLTRHLQTLATRYRARACQLFDELLAKQLATRPRRADRCRLEEIRQQLDQLRTTSPIQWLHTDDKSHT